MRAESSRSSLRRRCRRLRRIASFRVDPECLRDLFDRRREVPDHVALYLGARAYGSDRRGWMIAAWLVYALCAEGIGWLVWMWLAVAGAGPLPSGWFALLVVTNSALWLAALSLAASQTSGRAAERAEFLSARTFGGPVLIDVP